MNYIEAVQTILQKKKRGEILLDPRLLRGYLLDLVGDDYEGKRLVNVLTSVLKGESHSSLSSEKRWLALSYKEVDFPQEEVEKALDPFLNEFINLERGNLFLSKPKSYSIPFYQPCSFDSDSMEYLQINLEQGDLILKNGSISYWVPCGSDPSPFKFRWCCNRGHKEYFLDCKKKKKGKLDSLKLYLKENPNLDLYIRAMGDVIVEGHFFGLTIETKGSVYLKGNIVNLNIVSCSHLVHNAITVASTISMKTNI